MKSKNWQLTRDEYMFLDEVNRLIRSAEDLSLADLAKGRTSYVRSWAVIDLAPSTGLRVSEISEVRIGDLSLSGSEPQLIARKGAVFQQDPAPLSWNFPIFRCLDRLCLS